MQIRSCKPNGSTKDINACTEERCVMRSRRLPEAHRVALEQKPALSTLKGQSVQLQQDLTAEEAQTEVQTCFQNLSCLTCKSHGTHDLQFLGLMRSSSTPFFHNGHPLLQCSATKIYATLYTTLDMLHINAAPTLHTNN
jgi:hypothetical protein